MSARKPENLARYIGVVFGCNIEFYTQIKQDCSYQGDALNVPTAF